MTESAHISDIPKFTPVKVFFNNGTVVDGKVLHWAADLGILLSDESESCLMIYRPDQNVLMVKMPLKPLLEEVKKILTPQESPQQPEVVKQPVVKESVTPQPVQTSPFPPDQKPLSKVQQILEKKLEQNKHLRQKVAEKLQPAQLTTSPIVRPEQINSEQKLSRFGLEKYVIPNFKK